MKDAGVEVRAGPGRQAELWNHGRKWDLILRCGNRECAGSRGDVSNRAQGKWCYSADGEPSQGLSGVEDGVGLHQGGGQEDGSHKKGFLGWNWKDLVTWDGGEGNDKDGSGRITAVGKAGWRRVLDLVRERDPLGCGETLGMPGICFAAQVEAYGASSWPSTGNQDTQRC